MTLRCKTICQCLQYRQEGNIMLIVIDEHFNTTMTVSYGV